MTAVGLWESRAKGGRGRTSKADGKKWSHRVMGLQLWWHSTAALTSHARRAVLGSTEPVSIGLLIDGTAIVSLRSMSADESPWGPAYRHSIANQAVSAVSLRKGGRLGAVIGPPAVDAGTRLAPVMCEAVWARLARLARSDCWPSNHRW